MKSNEDDQSRSDQSAKATADQRAGDVAVTKHTPGPWHFVPENSGLMSDHGYGILFGDKDSFGWERNLFVSVGCSGNARRELGVGAAEANAHLIAAAPDYHAGVVEALTPNDGYNCEYVSIPVKAWRMILAAHAKAEGR